MHPLLDRFEANVAKHPDRPATSDPTLTLDYQSFRAVACGLAGQIREQTELPRVGIMAPTSTAAAAAIFAAWYAGKTPIPLNFMLKPAELAAVIRDAEIDTVVTIEHFAEGLRPTGLKLMLLGPDTLRPGNVAAPAADAADLATIIYTSGTNGEPKGGELTFDNVVQNALGCIEHAEIDPRQNFLGVIPQFHCFGFTTLTVVPLLLGATAYYLPRFTPTSIVSTIADKQISVFIAVASMFGAIANMKSVTAEQLASLDLPVSGGEALPPNVAAAWEKRFGKQIYEGYGMTEASPVVSINVPRAFKPGSVGLPLPGVSVVAVDTNDGDLPAGAEGELVVSGHCVMRGYRHKPDATAAAIRSGRLHTGDLGRVDESGHIYITGRVKDMIIVGGENVYPREIEEVLIRHPAVREAAAVGMPDDVRGELPVVFVCLSEGANTTDEALRSYCREHLANYKTPRQIRIVADLPHGSTGKVQKRELRRMLASPASP